MPRKPKRPGPHRYRPRNRNEPDWAEQWREKQGNPAPRNPEADRFWATMIGLDDDDEEDNANTDNEG